MVLTHERDARTPIVQRFRLRSTSEPPPNGPRTGAADAERAREAAVLARVQQHQEDQDEQIDLDDRENGVHGGEL